MDAAEHLIVRFHNVKQQPARPCWQRSGAEIAQQPIAIYECFPHDFELECEESCGG